MKLNKFRKGFIVFLALVGVFYGFQFLFRSPMPWLGWVFLVVALLLIPFKKIYEQFDNPDKTNKDESMDTRERDD